jgi:hypothetical protein
MQHRFLPFLSIFAFEHLHADAQQSQEAVVQIWNEIGTGFELQISFVILTLVPSN